MSLGRKEERKKGRNMNILNKKVHKKNYKEFKITQNKQLATNEIN